MANIAFEIIILRIYVITVVILIIFNVKITFICTHTVVTVIIFKCKDHIDFHTIKVLILQAH